MSISSMAQDSALRFGRSSPTLDQVVGTAAAVAAKAASGGAAPEDAAAEGAAAGQDATANATAVASSPLESLVKYIPTETITVYVALTAALGDPGLPADGKLYDADFRSRWVAVVVMLVVTALLSIGLSYRSQKDSSSTEKFHVPVFETVAACAAFLVWAFSLPTTPLRDIKGFDYSAWNSFIILAGTIAIAAAAYIFGKTVAWTKTVDFSAQTS